MKDYQASRKLPRDAAEAELIRDLATAENEARHV
jgi:hypothetical protein